MFKVDLRKEKYGQLVSRTTDSNIKENAEIN